MSEAIAIGYEDARTPRQLLLARLKKLEEERDLWIDTWMEQGNHFLPGEVRRNTSDRQRAPVANDPDVVNGTGILACRTFSSGLMSYLTSPASPWFALGLADRDLQKWGKVKSWLKHTADAMFKLKARSNFYQVSPSVYAKLGAIGTACTLLEEDAQTVARYYSWTTGSYALAASARGDVDTAYRRFQMTAGQMMEKFGPDRVSERVRNMFRNGQQDAYVDVIRAIEPNRYQDQRRFDFAGMPFASYWFEPGVDDKKAPFLRTGGYRSNPILAPRWDPVGEDVYGRCPGWQALYDSRGLQQYGRRNAQTTDYLTQPALARPAGLGSAYPLPGDTVSVPFAGAQSQMQPVWQVPPGAIRELDAKEQRLEQRVNDFWYASLWLMLMMSDQRQPVTAREIAERHEEKLLQIGPALVRLYNEYLDPDCKRTYELMMRESVRRVLAGLPPLMELPPDELQGQTLRVEYISPLAKAEKLVGIASDERLAGFVGNIFPVQPNVIDKVDWDKLLEGYADRTSSDPDVIVPQDVVDQKRAERARAQQQQAAAAAAPDLAKAGQVLSETDIRGTSALDRLLFANAGGSVPSYTRGT